MLVSNDQESAGQMRLSEKADQFEAARPQLMGIAFRLLGTLSEAEDAVQDTAFKWFSDDTVQPEKPTAWLSTVCTNRCLDILKSAQRKRTQYVGPWLPDQFQMETVASAEDQFEASSSLNTAFLLLLERLTPKERAAYILHDIFSMSFAEVSAALGITNENCRKLASRARKMIAAEQVRHVPTEEVQRQLLDGFTRALSTGDAGPLANILTQDATLRADSGGKVVAIREVLKGPADVVEFVASTLSKAWHGLPRQTMRANGQCALLIGTASDPVAVISFAFSDKSLIRDVFVLRHPEKLQRLLETSLTATASTLER